MRIVGAKIDGTLSCGESSFSPDKGPAILADLVEVGGAILLRAGTTFDNKGKPTPFRAKGEVRLLGARVGSDVDCDGGVFDNPSTGPDEAAITLERAEIKGALILRAHSGKRRKSGRAIPSLRAD